MPNFNFPGEKGGIFCAQHKAEGMVDIKHKRCVEPGCSKRPSFNYTGALFQHCRVSLHRPQLQEAHVHDHSALHLHAPCTCVYTRLLMALP